MAQQEQDSFIFLIGLDHMGSDLLRLDQSIHQLQTAALADTRCMAFNTLGYLKSDATNLTTSPYIHGENGIFLRKSFVEQVASGAISMHHESRWTQADAKMALVSCEKDSSFHSPVSTCAQKDVHSLEPTVHLSRNKFCDTFQTRFCTYGNQRFANSLARIAREACDSEWFDRVTVYRPQCLSPAFASKFKRVLDMPRGVGYWIWKYDVIAQEIEHCRDGDIIVFLDSGSTINLKGEARFREYVDMLVSRDECIISFQMNHIAEETYTTRQVFEYFQVQDDESITKTGQYVGGMLIMRVTDKLRLFLKLILQAIEHDDKLITDEYIHGQISQFKDCRHDQSLSSVMRKKLGSVVLPDETFFEPFGSQESLEFPFWATRKKE